MASGCWLYDRSGFCQHFSLGESYSSSSHPKAKHFGSSLCLWCPSTGTQSKWVQVNLWVGPLRGTPGTQILLHLTWPQSELVFTDRSCRDFSSWHWNPGWGSGVGLGCLTPQGALCIWDISWFLSPRMGVKPIWMSFYPSYQAQCSFFFISFVAGLLFIQIPESNNGSSVV